MAHWQGGLAAADSGIDRAAPSGWEPCWSKRDVIHREGNALSVSLLSRHERKTNGSFRNMRRNAFITQVLNLNNGQRRSEPKCLFKCIGANQKKPFRAAKIAETGKTWRTCRADARFQSESRCGGHW